MRKAGIEFAQGRNSEAGSVFIFNQIMVVAALPIQHILCSASALVLLVSFSSAVFAADVTQGGIIARRWCAACHLVAPEQTRASADVPSFASIAGKKLPPEQLKAFLTDPHPKMPDMNLTRSEIDDIVAYISSLGR